MDVCGSNVLIENNKIYFVQLVIDNFLLISYPNCEFGAKKHVSLYSALSGSTVALFLKLTIHSVNDLAQFHEKGDVAAVKWKMDKCFLIVRHNSKNMRGLELSVKILTESRM